MGSKEDIITYLVSWFFYFQSAFNKLRIYFGKYMWEKLGFELYCIVTLISQLIGRPGANTDLRPSGHQFTLPVEDCPRWLACPAILYLVVSRWPMSQHLWKSCETISDSAAHWCTAPIHHFDFNLIFALILTCSHIYIFLFVEGLLTTKHGIIGHFTYEDLPFTSLMSHPKLIENQRKYVNFRPDDVVVLTYAKAGKCIWEVKYQRSAVSISLAGVYLYT